MRAQVLIVLFCLGAVITLAQKAWKKNLEVADAYFTVHEYANASTYYEFSLNSHPTVSTILKLAECKELLRDFKSAARWYKRALNRRSTDSHLMLQCARAYRNSGSYEKAKYYFEHYSENSQDSTRVKNEIAYCDSALVWMKNKNTFSVKNIYAINTQYSDVAPSFYYDALVFSSNREGVIIKKKHGQTNEVFYNLYQSAENKKGKWDQPQPLGNVNSRNHEGGASFNASYSEVYFTRSEHTQGQNENQSDKNRLKLYRAEKKHLGWSFPEKFILNDSLNSFAHPSLSLNGKFFFFTSDLPGGYGGFDLYVCVKGENELWSKPINLGGNVNTSGNEMYPWYDDETKKLYFSSEGHLGMGGYDLFSSSLSHGDWGEVTNLQYPINTFSDDYSIIWKEGGLQGFICSNRQGGRGKEDIYKVIRK